MQILKQSTEIKVKVGPFVDKDDGVTPETGITLGAADQAELFKHDATAVTDISGATWAAITGADGWYNLTLTTSLTDTLGCLDVLVQDLSVCLPVFARFQVVPANVYDSLVGGSDTLDVNADTIWDALRSSHVTANTFGAGVLAESLNAQAKADVEAEVWDTARSAHVSAGTFGAGIKAESLNTQAKTDVGDACWDEARSGHTTGGTFGEGVKCESLNTQAKTDVNTEVVDTMGTDTLTELTTTPASTPTLRQAIMLLYMALRNKVDQTNSRTEIHNDAGTVVSEATVSDDGSTFTKSKYANP